MSKADGLYLSVDHRVSQLRAGRYEIVDDETAKHLLVLYPPENLGPRFLFAFTGIAHAPDGTPTGDWVRETLRGDMEQTVNDSLTHLRERLDRDYAPRRQYLQVMMLAQHGNQRVYGGFSNLTDASTMHVGTRFVYFMEDITNRPMLFAAGSGEDGVRRRYAYLQPQLDVWPRRTVDHMRLLATVNRQVAAEEPTVSPSASVLSCPARPGRRACTSSGSAARARRWSCLRWCTAST